MKIGAIILCRYSSTRLPGKILKSISGKPILQYIVERLGISNRIDQTVVATSNDPSDTPIVDFCEENEIMYYTGSLANVSQRFLDAAVSYDFDYAIRINGDNLFVDASIIDAMVERLEENEYDFVTNVPDRTFPIGMSVEIVGTEFYKNQLNKFTAPTDFEHVTQYLYQNPGLGRYHFIKNNICPEAKGLKLAIDNQKDFIFARAIIDRMHNDHTEYGLREIHQIANQVNNEFLER